MGSVTNSVGLCDWLTGVLPSTLVWFSTQGIWVIGSSSSGRVDEGGDCGERAEHAAGVEKEAGEQGRGASIGWSSGIRLSAKTKPNEEEY